MRNRYSCKRLCAALLLLFTPLGSSSLTDGKISVPPISSNHLLARLPVSFEMNRGQADSRVQYLARCRGYTAFFTNSEVVFVARRQHTRSLEDLLSRAEASHPDRDQVVLRLTFPGANTAPSIQSGAPLPGKSNYFIGKHASKWLMNIPNYSRIHYKDLYPGIDLVFTGAGGQLKYEFVVAPGADPNAIRLSMDGIMIVNVRGELVVRKRGAELRHLKPVAFQHRRGICRDVRTSYSLAGSEVRFDVGGFEPESELVIDPLIAYSTFLGGAGYDQGGDASDSGMGVVHGAVAVDQLGQAYITGNTASVDFPILGAVQPDHHGGYDDAFIAKLDASGSSLLFSTYLGGSGDDQGNGVTIDAAGDVYISGRTLSDDFPVTPGALQSNRSNACCNVFVTKLAGSGSAVLYSTYLGGNVGEEGHGIAVDGDGNAYTTSQTASTDFPTTQGAFQRQFGGGMYDVTVSKLNPDASALVYSTYIGGSGTDNIAYNSLGLNGRGELYLAGRTSSLDFPLVNPIQPQYGGGIFDAWFAKLNAAGSALVYSTYFGGSGDDRALGVAVDAFGNHFAVGNTSSTNLPVANAFQPKFGGGAQDCFIVAFDPSGTRTAFATYLGGSRLDYCLTVVTDTRGSVYVAGLTRSADFPMAVEGPHGTTDVFLSKWDARTNKLAYSLLIGGSGDQQAWGLGIDPAGNVYIQGTTNSRDFPTTDGVFQSAYGGGDSDSFVTKIEQ